MLRLGVSARIVVCSAVLPPTASSPVTMDWPGNNKLIHSVALLNNNE